MGSFNDRFYHYSKRSLSPPQIERSPVSSSGKSRNLSTKPTETGDLGVVNQIPGFSGGIVQLLALFEKKPGIVKQKQSNDRFYHYSKRSLSPPQIERSPVSSSGKSRNLSTKPTETGDLGVVNQIPGFSGGIVQLLALFEKKPGIVKQKQSNDRSCIIFDRSHSSQLQ